MPPDNADIVIGYHDRTKHHPGRYARSLGYLDWATQPDPFRRFEGAALFPLPIPEDEDTPAYDELYVPGAIAPQGLSVESISRFFYLSLALSAWKQSGAGRWALRCNPSSGNLHPTEGYAILPGIEGLVDDPGVYHYAPLEHGLELRARLTGEAWRRLGELLEDGAFLVGLSSIHWREAWKYGERAFRYCNHDVGHALGALRMAAASLGWRLTLLEQAGDEEIGRLLGLDRGEDFAGAEPEMPALLAVVSPAARTAARPSGCVAEAAEAVAGCEWLGHASVLSRGHVDWEIIDAVAAACRKPPGGPIIPPGTHTATPAEPGPSPARAVSAHHVIRTRRSALAFDGSTVLPAAVFYRMLERLLPRRAADTDAFVSAGRPPWDCVGWPPRVHLFLFVHRVEGVAPGLYAMVRDPRKTGMLLESCQASFAWRVPEACPPHLPLFLLTQADCRRAATQLSLHQEIAGMGALSLGMIAELEETVRQAGAWAYRHLYWEAGVIGQVLYLEAQAAGLRATGIGAFFDDAVHEVLGLSGHRFQSLYHFTMGGHVEDPRVVSGPAYPARATRIKSPG
jgi:SagB-type dehydrogenase family enzyme